jgi:GTPase SAR1 family protein
MIVTDILDGQEGKTFFVTMQEKQRDGVKLELRISMLGDSSAGKSTFVIAVDQDWGDHYWNH